MSDPGFGWLTPAAGGIALELTTTVTAELLGGADSGSGEYALASTTGTAAEGAAPTPDAAEASGAAIDPVTRAARLVATATIGAESPVGAGEALVVVLEGRFEGLPASLR